MPEAERHAGTERERRLVRSYVPTRSPRGEVRLANARIGRKNGEAAAAADHVAAARHSFE
jgi:hypothetical protein